MKQYLLDRLSEPSTWIAIGAVCNAFALDLTPDQVQAVTMLAGAIFVSKG